MAYVVLLETFYYINFKWLAPFAPLRSPLRYGYFWNQGVKLHHIGWCHFVRKKEKKSIFFAAFTSALFLASSHHVFRFFDVTSYYGSCHQIPFQLV